MTTRSLGNKKTKHLQRRNCGATTHAVVGFYKVTKSWQRRHRTTSWPRRLTTTSYNSYSIKKSCAETTGTCEGSHSFRAVCLALKQDLIISSMSSFDPMDTASADQAALLSITLLGCSPVSAGQLALNSNFLLRWASIAGRQMKDSRHWQSAILLQVTN